jgi:hypothetical protein
MIEADSHSGGTMRLDLTDDETRIFRQFLHDYLPTLRREIARTDARDFRHELVKRQDLCERLLDAVEGKSAVDLESAARARP